MAAPETKGRMINKDISESKHFAKLSPEAAVLFCMIIPHLNGHGKMKGGVGYIKDEVCPLVPYISGRKLPRLLHEIDANTNVKWFKWEGRDWIHSINFLSEHQNLRKEKLGRDLLPDYSGTSSVLSPDEVPLQVEVEVEVEDEGGKGSPGLKPPPPKILEGFKPSPTAIADVKEKYGFSDSVIEIETEKFIAKRRAESKTPADPEADWKLWMLRQWEFVGGPAGKKAYDAQRQAEEERRKEREREEAEIEANKCTPEETRVGIQACRRALTGGQADSNPVPVPDTSTDGGDDIPW